MDKLLIKLETELKAVSKQRPKSLILRIPVAVREAMNLEQGTPLIVEVCFNEKDNIYFRCTKKD